MGNDFHPSLVYAVEYIDLEEATGEKDANWAKHQLRFLNNYNLMTIDVKSRQIGWSWIAAMDAYAHAALNRNSISLFISVTQQEANEKIRYVNLLHSSTDRDVRPVKVVDNKSEVEFSNGARIISHPCRPPRGKGRARVYVDEFAHYPKDEEIYAALMPIITRGGVVRVGSSPLGARGMFWDIFTQSTQSYTGYKRRLLPWWAVEELCENVPEAMEEAPRMATEDRVYKYGGIRVKIIYENMVLEDFQQEYECEWSDETVSWLTWDEIKRNQELASLEKLPCITEAVTLNQDFDDAFFYLEQFEKMVDEGTVPDILFAGYDVGRKRNASELMIVTEGPDESFPLCFGLTLDRIEFGDQRALLEAVLERLPIETLLIDSNGLGMQLAEELEIAFPSTAQGFNFTGSTKEDLAVLVKTRFQAKKAPIPLDRDLAYQIHSIKKKVTAGARVIFDTDANTKHHADKFWALALAHGASEIVVGMETGASPTGGYRG